MVFLTNIHIFYTKKRLKKIIVKLKNNCKIWKSQGNVPSECCQHLMKLYEFFLLLQDITECKQDQNLNKMWGKRVNHVTEINTFSSFTSLWFHSLGDLSSDGVTFKVVTSFRVPDPSWGSVRDSHLKPFVGAARTLPASGQGLASAVPGGFGDLLHNMSWVCGSEEGPPLRETPIWSLCLHLPGLRMFRWSKRQINTYCLCVSVLKWRVTGLTVLPPCAM